MRALVISQSITRRDSKALEKYLNEVSHYELLTPELEVELFQRARVGDQFAFEKIINSNLRFVISVAKQYQHTGMSLADLISEGNVGLIKAAKRFDETKGFKFISYAVWWIRQSILQAIGDKSRQIRIPVSHQSDLIKVLSARDQLLQDLEREPTPKEISDLTELGTDTVEKCLANKEKCASLDAPIQSGEEATLEYFVQGDNIPLPDENLTKKESLKQEIKMLLDQLKPREAAIISMYFGIGDKRALGLSEISEILGIGKERVRQIKYRGLRKLMQKIQLNDMTFSY